MLWNTLVTNYGGILRTLLKSNKMHVSQLWTPAAVVSQSCNESLAEHPSIQCPQSRRTAPFSDRNMRFKLWCDLDKADSFVVWQCRCSHMANGPSFSSCAPPAQWATPSSMKPPNTSPKLALSRFLPIGSTLHRVVSLSMTLTCLLTSTSSFQYS